MPRKTRAQKADESALRPSNGPSPAPQCDANPVLHLQRRVGNQAVMRMLNAGAQDRNRNVAPPAAPAATAADPLSSGVVRRCACGSSGAGKCASCQEEEQLRRSSADGSDGGGLAPQVVNDALRSPGQPLEESTRAFMESRLGHDFRNVRVSSDDTSAGAADAIRAKAFTYGNRIVFGRNEYVPNSASGLRLLAHELAHTAQQRSGAPALQANLRIGSVDDPQEREADLAAETALGTGQAPSLSGGAPTVRRAPKEGYSWEWKGVNQGVYTDAGGVKYTVTRSFKPVTVSEKTKVDPGVAFARAFVTIKWCRNPIRGKAEVGIDITNQLQQLVPQILATGNPAQVLRQAQLTPYVQVVTIQSDKGTTSFDIQADVGQQGVTAVRGGVGIETGIGRVGVNVGVDLPPGGQPAPSVGVTITPGGKKEKVQCQTTTYEDTYECTKEETVPPSDIPITIKLPSPDRIRHIYFDYAKDIVTSPSTKYGKDHPEVVARNTASFDAIKNDLGDGYRIAAIEGFTSPEGPMDPKGKFEGNTNLSQERADAALKVLAEGLCAVRRDDACFAHGKDAIKPRGKGELYTKVEGGKEAEGKELAEFAVPAFRESEESTLTGAESQALEKKRGAVAQSEVVYPLLRRAKITLTRGPVPTTVMVHDEGGVKTTTVDCPKSVLQAAKKQFKLRDMGVGTGGL